MITLKFNQMFWAYHLHTEMCDKHNIKVFWSYCFKTVLKITQILPPDIRWSRVLSWALHHLLQKWEWDNRVFEKEDHFQSVLQLRAFYNPQNLLRLQPSRHLCQSYIRCWVLGYCKHQGRERLIEIGILIEITKRINTNHMNSRVRRARGGSIPRGRRGASIHPNSEPGAQRAALRASDELRLACGDQ